MLFNFLGNSTSIPSKVSFKNISFLFFKELVEQREKLENIEKRCDGIDANLVSAQQNLNKLGSIFGGIKNYFHPPKTAFPKSASQPQLSNNAKTKTAAATSVATRPTNPKDDTDTYFGKPRSAMDDIERETEDGLRKFIYFHIEILFYFLLFILDDIHLGVNRLKMLALHMNEELESQKPLTDRLAVKLEVLNQDVAKKNKVMKEIVSQ